LLGSMMWGLCGWCNGGGVAFRGDLGHRLAILTGLTCCTVWYQLYTPTHLTAIEVLPCTIASASPRLSTWCPATHRFFDKPHRSTAGMVRYNHWTVLSPLVGGNGSTVCSSPSSHPILSSYPNFRAEHPFYLALITCAYHLLLLLPRTWLQGFSSYLKHRWVVHGDLHRPSTWPFRVELRGRVMLPRIPQGICARPSTISGAMNSTKGLVGVSPRPDIRSILLSRRLSSSLGLSF